MKLRKIKKEGKEIFICDCCQKEYDQIPFCFGAGYPAPYFTIPDHEKEARIELEKSLCIIDEKFFFHQGQLEIPIIDYSENLIFNVWVSISEENFEKRMDSWNDHNRVNNEPYFGWLQTMIPTYDNTINLETFAVEQELDSIPKIQITGDHLLKQDQNEGIKFEKAMNIISSILDTEH